MIKVTSTEYSVLVYDHKASDEERCFGTSVLEEAEEVFAQMRQRFPNATIRFSIHTYFDPSKRAEDTQPVMTKGG
jgi:hypothetical protein